MKIEQRQVYISDDGQPFATAAECEAHEAEMLKRKAALSALKVYSVTHGFDATEGRGYFARTIIVTDASEPVLLQWCLDNLGQPLSGWYGDSFYESWILNRTDKSVDWALEQQGKVPYSYHTATTLVMLSKADWAWAGLPASQHPWPRKAKK
jgi:hypothetical protein